MRRRDKHPLEIPVDLSEHTPAELADAADGFVQMMPREALVAVAAGALDLNTLAVLQLANRGLDRTGVWVGFPAAKADAEAVLAERLRRLLEGR